jgi:hypothetical protein
MSQALADYASALHEVERAATRKHLAELDLSDENSSALAVNHAEADLCRAACELTRAVDALPRDRRPKNWRTT